MFAFLHAGEDYFSVTNVIAGYSELVENLTTFPIQPCLGEFLIYIA